MVLVFWCDFRGLGPGFWCFGVIFGVWGWLFFIDQGLGFSIHWLGFRVYAFSFVFCGREHQNHWKKMKNNEKIIQKWIFRDIPA
jgi:hypothetical protein